jgi:hypothetical protein
MVTPSRAEEQFSTLALNEAKTFVHDQLFDRTLRHDSHSSKKTETKKHNRSLAVVDPSLPQTTVPT